ncbi:DUF2341 domain-containing protein [bacterium]|nr:DUF2341 domain-containing protein [bacterium]
MVVKREKKESVFTYRFSLVEIILYLSAVVFLVVSIFIYLTGHQLIARDKKRIKDIETIQAALNHYYKANGFYPEFSSWICLESSPEFSQKVARYLNKIPEDPFFKKEFGRNKKFCYHYKTVKGGEEYKLYTFLEKTKRIVQIYSEGGKGIYTGAAGEEKWYDTNFKFRRKISFKKDEIGGSLKNFPLLLKIKDKNLSKYAKDNGRDIIFTDGEGKKLKRDIISFNKTDGELTAFVKVPLLSKDEGLPLFIYYGNPQANEEIYGKVFDKNFLGVYHFDDLPLPTSSISEGTSLASSSASSAVSVLKKALFSSSSSSSPSSLSQTTTAKLSFKIPDAGENNISGVWQGPITKQITNGKIFRALWFNGLGSISLGTSTLFSDMDGLTLEAWVYPQTQKEMGIFGWQGDGMDAWQLFLSKNSKAKFVVRTDKGVFPILTQELLKQNEWNYLAAVFSQKKISIFLNGKLLSKNIPEGKFVRGKGSFVELGSYNKKDYNFEGFLDEMRISNIARTEDWIMASWENQADPEKFVSLGIQEFY